MEGLIPFVYNAIVQYKNGKQGGVTWFPDSPSASYMRLPGDSGRFQATDLFRPEYTFSTSSASSTPTRAAPATATTAAAAAQRVMTTGVQSSPVRRLTARRLVA